MVFGKGFLDFKKKPFLLFPTFLLKGLGGPGRIFFGGV